jgi:Domain of unknown function (DUF4249)
LLHIWWPIADRFAEYRVKKAVPDNPRHGFFICIIATIPVSCESLSTNDNKIITGMRNKSRWWSRAVSVAGLLSMFACVNGFDPDLNLGTDLLVVEGIITDLPTPQAVTLARARSTGANKASTTPVTKATVAVLVNGTPVSLTETQPGRYELPAGFRGKVGASYQLRFQTAEGLRYESDTETMLSGPPIANVYDVYNPENPNPPKLFNDGLPNVSNDVYVDFNDPADQRNFYLWRTRLYEEQNWCATCQQSRYKVEDVGPVGTGPIKVLGCVPDPRLNTYTFFDYVCRDYCWDIFYSTNTNIFADVYSNGQAQRGRLVAQVPVYQSNSALLDVEQLALTPGAYRYYKLFQDQTQNTGTLVDTPPAPTVGNVRNLADDAENVVGYFTAASASVNHYWLDRKNVPQTLSLRGLFYVQNRRKPQVEIPPALLPGETFEYGKGIPSAICVPSATRTNDRPTGWR